MARPKGTRNGDGKPYKRGNTYYAAISVAGKLKRVSLKTSNYKLAVKLRDKLVREEREKASRQLLADQTGRIPLDIVWERFAPFAETMTPRLAREYKKNWSALVAHCERFGVKTLDAITKTHAVAFLAEIGKQGKTAEAISKYRVQCGKIIKAVSDNKIGNPFDGIKRSVGATKSAELYDTLSQSQADCLLNVAGVYERERNAKGVGNGEEWGLMFEIAYNTGLRLKDVCLLKWSEVKLDGERIQKITAKTGETVSIPLFPPLLEKLKALYKGLSDKILGSITGTLDDMPAYVLPNIAARYQSGDNAGNIQTGIKEIFDMAIPGSKVRVAQDGRTYKKSFHSFRVCLASRLGAQGCPFLIAKQILGHSAVMFEHYFRNDEALAHQYMVRAFAEPAPPVFK